MKLTVNESNTIRNFSSVFSDKTKVISELIQNARRAGATRIELSVIEVDEKHSDIIVTDNGKGIDDFAKLFAMSESGWNDAASQAENAFGMGFFSVFYSSDSVLIQSNGKRMDVDSERARCMEDFGEPLTDDYALHGVTKITLRNAKISASTAISKVTALATYSRLPIYINGELAESDYSLQALRERGTEVVDTPFGHLALVSPFESSLKVVVQDLVVFTEYNKYEQSNILYSDSLKARMPDRDVLIDSDNTVKTIRDWINNFFAQRLATIRSEMADDVAYLDRYFKQVLKYAPKMLNEIDYLPAHAFQDLYYQVQRSDYTTESVSIEKGVHRGEQVLAFADALDISEHPVGANFQYFAKVYIPTYTLPSDHWFWAVCVKDVKESDFIVSCYNAYHFDFSVSMFSGDAVAAETISITHIPSGAKVEVNDDFMADEDYNYSGDYAQMCVDGDVLERPASFVIKKGSAGVSEWLLLQAQSYTSEYDDWLDTDLEQDLDSFNRQMIAASVGDINSILCEILGHLPPAIAERLEGKLLNMSVVNGKAHFEMAA